MANVFVTFFTIYNKETPPEKPGGVH